MIFWVSLWISFWSTLALGQTLAQIRSSVIKIKVGYQAPRFGQPWMQHNNRESSGTGFYIGNGQILTNAHVVDFAKFITVLRDGKDHEVVARVAHIAHDCDLAILEVRDPDYLKDLLPLEIGGMPKVRKPVTTIGYPRGGEQISITEGIVSRVSYRNYAHSGGARHLLAQVDSAINPGNSGGPVIQGRKVVGVAFQSHSSAENTGYVIPPPVVRRFLRDVEDGRYDGHPIDALEVSEGVLENPGARAYYGVPDDLKGGVVVQSIASFSPLSEHLNPGDIITAIEGQPVGVDGQIEFQGERVSFKVLYDLKLHGETVTLKIFREGKAETIDIKVTKENPHYWKYSIHTEYPRYRIFAGLVFTSLSRDYLETWGKKWWESAPHWLRYFHREAWSLPELSGRSDIIVLAERLPHAVNTYAQAFEKRVLRKMDGFPLFRLEDMDRRLVKGREQAFIRFEFEGDSGPLILDRSKAMAADQEILSRYQIPQAAWLGGPDQDGATAGWEEQP